MANGLTGDNEAVIQIAVRQVNGLLATLHQNGATEDAPLKLLHSVSMRLDEPRPKRPWGDVFGDWVLERAKAAPGLGLGDIRDELTAAAPPGAAKALADAFAGFLDRVAEEPAGPDLVRGSAKLQLSPVDISVPDGSTSEIVVHAHVRARFHPDPGTPELPAPIHGQVRTAFVVSVMPTAAGRRVLIRPSAQDKTEFIPAPGTGLSAADTATIVAQVRRAVREGFELLPVDLPPNFPFAGFKGLGTGDGQAIALPMQLSDAPPPPNPLGGLTQQFVGSSGFGFAVSADFVRGVIDTEAIREAIRQRTVTLGIGWPVEVSVTYRFRFSSGPTLTFRAGAIEISGRVEVETSTSWAPDGYVSFRQAVALALDPAAQTVSLEPVGGPDVDESWFIPHGRAVSIVESEIAAALASNTPAVNQLFGDAKASLVASLRTFDAFSSATYTELEIAAGGIIVRGEIAGAPRGAPVVRVAETPDGTFTGFESWIPGGRIERFVWSWVEYKGLVPSPWSGVAKSLTDEHRFVLAQPPGITDVGQVCLRLEGTRTLPGGQAEAVVAGTTCLVQKPGLVLDLPAWWEPLTVPTWVPGVRGDIAVRDAIAGHVSVQSDPADDGSPLPHSLVYFADWESAAPLDALADILARAKESVPVFVVLPEGAFNASRNELERRLGPARDRIPARVELTEDDQGGWTRVFGVTRAPSLYVIKDGREVAWWQEGEPDPAAVASALTERLRPPAASRFRPLRLAVSPGDRAPDVSFRDEAANPFAIRRLRGSRILLNFWQSWSAPCLAELRRLEGVHQEADESLFIAGFHGGKDAKSIDRVRRELGISFPLVDDREQRIARRYGVRCWPTTVSIGPESQVDHVQLGLSRPRGDTSAQRGRGETGRESAQ